MLCLPGIFSTCCGHLGLVHVLVTFSLSFSVTVRSFYELVFSSLPSDYVLLPRVTDLKDMTSCWWIKTEPHPDWSTVFSFYTYDDTSVLRFSYHGNGNYLLHVGNTDR